MISVLTGNPVSGIIAIIVAYVFVSTFLRWYQLRQFNGPPFAWLSALWMTRKILTMQSHQEFLNISKTYGRSHTISNSLRCVKRGLTCCQLGNLCRIGPNDLLTDDPEVALYMGKAKSKYRKSDYYDGLEVDPAAKTILLERDNVRHAKLRSQMAPGVRNHF
jgi:hypothetical protein